MSRRHLFFASAAGIALAADQSTKALARAYLWEGRKRPFLGDFWDWALSYNRASAFGLFHDLESARWVLTAIGVVACVVILFVLRRIADSRGFTAAALGMVLGGALGNLIDRVAFGKVTDFVYWHVGSFRWPVFNVADAALVVGIVILVLDVGKKRTTPGP